MSRVLCALLGYGRATPASANPSSSDVLGRAARAYIKAELNIEFSLYKSKRPKQQTYDLIARQNVVDQRIRRSGGPLLCRQKRGGSARRRRYF
jgi:hypothetical protein